MEKASPFIALHSVLADPMHTVVPAWVRTGSINYVHKSQDDHAKIGAGASVYFFTGFMLLVTENADEVIEAIKAAEAAQS